MNGSGDKVEGFAFEVVVSGAEKGALGDADVAADGYIVVSATNNYAYSAST